MPDNLLHIPNASDARRRDLLIALIATGCFGAASGIFQAMLNNYLAEVHQLGAEARGWLEFPRELVWRAWTEPDMMMQWWGPHEWSLPVCKLDFRVGGKVLSLMRGKMPDGQTADIWSTGIYKEIVPLEKIVMTDSFADQDGNVVPASHYGMTEDNALEMLITVTFEDTPGGGTKMIMRHDGLSRTEQEGANAGWSESFDKLTELLKVS